MSKSNKEQALYEKWEAEGQPLSYVRFSHSIPRFLKEEPVYEFKLEAEHKKHIVDKLTMTEHGLVWRCGKELNHVPPGPIVFSRAIKSEQSE